MSVTELRSTSSIGAELERDRLEHRSRRVTLVIAELRQKANERARQADAAPWCFPHLIADFETQIEAMNARLQDLARPFESAESLRPESTDANTL